MKRLSKFLSLFLAVLIMLSSMAVILSANVFAASANISYNFTKSTAGYAQGTITLTADNGTYYLYWADNSKALADYSEIAKLTVTSGKATVTMPAYTAIPADATKLIAIKSTSVPANTAVSAASAVYNIPASRMLNVDTDDALYTFGSISDPQLANDNHGSGSYPYDEIHLAAALETLANRKVDFTISSGDTVNDQNGNQTYAAEYKAYQKLLADSSYCNPIYEANGNHDVGTVWDKNGNYYNNNAPFVKATGLDSKKETINAGKPYFEVTEPTTGDHFIFMALEGGFYTNKGTQFSTAQLNWLEGLLKKYSGDGKNIFIIEHANVGGWGAGDNHTEPYYDLALDKSNADVKRFVSLMETYKDCVIITGHTHLELSAQYNYSDNNGKSAVMIHNSAIGGVRRLVNGSIDRSAVLGLSEGYIVEVYESCILFNGTNMYSGKTMPQCSYIVPMSTSENEGNETEPTQSEDDSMVTITLRDMTDEGWMVNNATQREIQLIDNDTNTKYIMTSYDGFKSWVVDVPRSVTNITFKRVRMSDNVDRNIWYAGQRNGSLEWCVLDQDEEVIGIGYWNTSVTEPPVIATTAPETTAAPKPTAAPVTTAAPKPTTLPETTVVTKPMETTSISTKATDPAETTVITTAATDPAETTVITTSSTDPAETTIVTTATTDPSEPSTAPGTTANTTVTVSTTGEETTTESEPFETSDVVITTAEVTTTTENNSSAATSTAPVEYMYGDADLNGKVNVRDATAIQKAAAKLTVLSEIAAVQADVTGDTKVNIKDATTIQKFVAKLVEKFPVEEAALVAVGAATYTADQDLADYYTFSSYNQYMDLKKAKRNSASQSVITSLQKALYDIAGARPEEPSGEFTIYFSDTNSWGTVYAHLFGTAGDLKTWPGTVMTYDRTSDSGKKIYKITFDYSKYQSVVFHNGNGTQTVDINIEANKTVYHLNTESGGKWTVGSYEYKW